MSKCFHLSFRSMFRIVFLCTLNFRAKSSLVWSLNFLNLRVSDISNTCAFVSLEKMQSSPLSGSFLSLPFAILSSLLSLCVPRNKCAGLQQGGLSHVWHTNLPHGISPFQRVNTILCASQVPSLPYPPADLFPGHSQHSESPPCGNFAQNLLNCSGLKFIDRVVNATISFWSPNMAAFVAAFQAKVKRWVRPISIL